jgi:hypothetical protein
LGLQDKPEQMRRSLLLIVSLFFLATAEAQDSFKTEITLDDSTKAKYLAKVIPLDKYCIFYEFENDPVDRFIRRDDGNFQFYQTSSKDTLLVFDGKLCGGHETGVVNVYQFANGVPETALSQPGKVASMHEDEVWVYTYPCCAQVLNIIVPFSLRTGEKRNSAHVFYSRFDYANIFPIKEKANQKYELSRESEIHWSPFEKDDSHVPVCNSYENVIAKMPQGTPFTLIEVSSNDWALIRLDNMLTSKGYCIGQYHQNLIGGDEYALYGWIPVSNVKWE